MCDIGSCSTREHNAERVREAWGEHWCEEECRGFACDDCEALHKLPVQLEQLARLLAAARALRRPLRPGSRAVRHCLRKHVLNHARRTLMETAHNLSHKRQEFRELVHEELLLFLLLLLLRRAGDDNDCDSVAELLEGLCEGREDVGAEGVYDTVDKRGNLLPECRVAWCGREQRDGGRERLGKDLCEGFIGRCAVVERDAAAEDRERSEGSRGAASGDVCGRELCAERCHDVAQQCGCAGWTCAEHCAETLVEAEAVCGRDAFCRECGEQACNEGRAVWCHKRARTAQEALQERGGTVAQGTVAAAHAISAQKRLQDGYNCCGHSGNHGTVLRSALEECEHDRRGPRMRGKSARRSQNSQLLSTPKHRFYVGFCFLLLRRRACFALAVLGAL